MTTVRVEGLERLKIALAGLRASVHAGALEGQQAAAQAVSEQWKALAPVETGEYRDSIGSDADGAFATAEHSRFVEFGTSTQAAQPAGSEAAARTAPKIPDIVATKIRKRLP